MGKYEYNGLLWKKNGKCYCSQCRKEIIQETFKLIWEERMGFAGIPHKVYMVCPYRKCQRHILLPLEKLSKSVSDIANFKNLREETMEKLLGCRNIIS